MGFFGLQWDGLDVELNSTMSLRGKITGAQRVALFARRFGHEQSDESFEAWIISEWIEHWIEPEQRRSERHVLSQCAIVRYREYLL